MVRDIITEYEDEIGKERRRLEAMTHEQAEASSIVAEMEGRGDLAEARQARQRVAELQGRIDLAENAVDRLEQLLIVFRRKLAEIQRIS